MTQPQNKAEKCEHKNRRRWIMDLESGTRCDDCGADLSLKFSVSQPQISVRERAREMFEQKFVNLVDVTGFNDEYTRYAHRPTKKQREIMNFIDQIITLAQEEKISELFTGEVFKNGVIGHGDNLSE